MSFAVVFQNSTEKSIIQPETRVIAVACKLITLTDREDKK